MSGGRHCYLNSDVLANKYNIRDKEFLRKNPMYVRDSLAMANYGQKEYLIKIILE